MSENKSIGARLREELLERFGSLDKAASVIGASRGTYFGAYLSGKSKPGGIVIKKLKEAGCDVDYIMTGKRGNVEGKAAGTMLESLEALRRLTDDIQYRTAQIAEDSLTVKRTIENLMNKQKEI